MKINTLIRGRETHFFGDREKKESIDLSHEVKSGMTALRLASYRSFSRTPPPSSYWNRGGRIST